MSYLSCYPIYFCPKDELFYLLTSILPKGVVNTPPNQRNRGRFRGFEYGYGDNSFTNKSGVLKFARMPSLFIQMPFKAYVKPSGLKRAVSINGIKIFAKRMFRIYQRRILCVIKQIFDTPGNFPVVI